MARAPSLLNCAAAKRFILETVASERDWVCTRVSAAALDLIEAKTRLLIERMVASHPSIGKTFLGE